MSKRRSPGDGTLFKRGNNLLWVGRVELPSTDGKRRYREVSSKNRNEAIAKLKQLKADVAAGKVAVTSKTTVEAWLARWIEDIRGPKLRPGTKQDYARTIKLHIVPHVGRFKLDVLTPQHVRTMQTAIPQSRTAQLAHVILRSSLDDAIKEGMLTRNVAEVADKPRHVTQAREPLSADQAKQLLRSAIDNDDPWATRWAAALLLGARQGELLGLEWDRLDLVNGVADFSWQLQSLTQEHGCGNRHSDETYPCGRKKAAYCPQRVWKLDRGFEYREVYRSLLLTRPKTKAGTRIVPIPAPLWAMLIKHQDDVLKTTNDHDFVWSHEGHPVSPRDDYGNWQDALKTAGLPAAPLHVARNTCATLLAQAGVPEDIRMAILGQVSITAHRSYVYRDQAQNRQAMTALDQLLG